MKVLYTSLSDARGKLGGLVASKNRSGNFYRIKVTPINRQSTAQLLVRGILAFFSAAWASVLTEAQRIAWDSAAPSYPRTNVFGHPYNPTGKNLFTALNTNAKNVGQTVTIADPPLPESIPAPTLAMTNTTAAAWVIVGGGLSATYEYLIRATPPMSAGVNFFKGKFKIVTFLNGAVTLTSGFGPTQYDAMFGAPQVGQKIAIQVIAINKVTGNHSLLAQTSFIVT